MAKARNKTCLDCLHCKVSSKSTVNVRLCYCATSEKTVRHRELYWLVKKACKEFEDMGAYIE